MKALWKDYSTKFLILSPREQYLIIISGLVVVTFIFFSMVIDGKLIKTDKLNKQVRQTTTSNKSAKAMIDILQQSLNKDPNVSIQKQIAQYENNLSSVDSKLLLLTSDLINPIQMRHALVKLLRMQKTVSLLSFDVIEAEPLISANPDNEQLTVDNNESNKVGEGKEALTLYKHGIKLKLKGSYFKLRDYLTQLEKLDWTFFWHEFDYQLYEYPEGELIIQMYSLSTKKEFIGV
jgi:MSHA biogenesis protein MshJ